MSAPSVTTHGRSVFWWDSEILPAFDPRCFDVDWLRAQGRLSGSAPGRGQSHFLNMNGRALVLREFARGGLVRKLSARSFLRLGAKRSRAYREYRLLGWMRDRGLAVPRPVAARYEPTGLCYRAGLITERIPNARTVAEAAQASALPPGAWHQIGVAVRRIHDSGVDHVDLNCRNILLDDTRKVWVIDFDRCRRRRTGGWAKANITRLERSLLKESRNSESFFWSDADWSEFLRGYHSDGPGR